MKIDLYFADESWRSDVEDEDSVNEAWLAQKAASLILEELEDLGITTNLELDDLFLSDRSTKALFFFRRKFDYEGLREYLRTRPDSVRAHIRDLIENTATPEDLLTEMVMYLKDEDPLDATWYVLSLELDYWCSTNRLSQHLQAIMDELDGKVDVDDDIEDTDVPRIAQMLGKIQLIRSRMRRCCEPLCTSIDFGIDGSTRIYELVDNYDSQLIRPDMQALYAAVYDDPNADLMQKHRRKVRHHVECWHVIKRKADNNEMDGDMPATSRISMITIPQLAMLVLCAVFEEDNPDHLKELKDILLPESYALLEKMLGVVLPLKEE